jgi:hypothetical protein
MSDILPSLDKKELINLLSTGVDCLTNDYGVSRQIKSFGSAMSYNTRCGSI